jgi:phosphohistidine swiveling domain-containing protein
MTSEAAVGWDILDEVSPAHAFWSTSNFGEAMPGVMTPLGWSIWRGAAELAIREGFYQLGALSRAERGEPADPADRVIGIFRGRVAGRVDFFASMGDRIPGTSARAVAETLLGEVPDGLESHPTLRRYPFVAARFPRAFVTITPALRKVQQETHDWWTREVATTAALSHAQAAARLGEARDRFARNVVLDGVQFMCAVQPVYEQMTKLAARAGIADVTALMGGYGSHAESAMVTDLWAASRGTLTVDDVIRRNGYHGPREGEISGVMWREDSAPVARLIEGYRAMGDEADPARQEVARRDERLALERQLLAALPRAGRAKARLVMRLASTIIPMRGVAKAAFLQSFDMARASARRIGECLAVEGVLADREDVFYLTVTELTAPTPPADAKQLVASRREREAEYQKVTIPKTWRGEPVVVPVTPAALDEDAGADVLTGVGASPGVVTGIVRVVHDPTFEDVEPGEILVSATTDPSWASIMFISKALVVDIGGVLSHAAVVARELGVPCVVNTRVGTRVLRSGDEVRVDGTTGQVDILTRAEGTSR